MTSHAAKTCRIRRCKGVCGQLDLMCKEHWRLVPRTMQKEIWHWRAKDRESIHYQRAIGNALRFVREALLEAPSEQGSLL